MPDHVHMLIAIPPKYSVTGFIKGKSAIWIAQERLSAWRQVAKLRLRHCGHLQVRNCGANGF
jgi:REP element-mobilizing transposase RayT